MGNYGHVRDVPDARDVRWTPTRTRAALPTVVDLRPTMPAVWNQTSENACVGYGLTAVAAHKSGAKDLSKLFAYWNTRWDTLGKAGISQDRGCALRDMLKSLAKTGICREALYDSNPGHVFHGPPRSAYDDAATRRVTGYSSLSQDRDASGLLYVLDNFRACLAGGNPFAFGFVVTDHLRCQDYTLLPPDGPIDPRSDSHCVCAVGYDDTRKAVLCRNSWGSGWALKGHFWMPYALLIRPDFAFDVWTIDAISG